MIFLHQQGEHDHHERRQDGDQVLRKNARPLPGPNNRRIHAWIEHTPNGRDQRKQTGDEKQDLVEREVLDHKHSYA
jgi:hypothetical protein